MRVLARVVVGCGVAVAAVPTVLVGSAAAGSEQTARPAVLSSAWFWHQATSDQLDGTPAQGAVPEPSGVPAGDLGLAITDPSSGTVSKEPYLAFDLSAAAPGSTISGFTFTLPLDPAATQADPQTVPLKACLPTRLWSNNPQSGTDWGQKPTDDCSASVKGSYDAAKQAYTFAVPAYARGWLDDVNTGVAILPDGYTSPFQLVFAGAKAVAATMTYAPALTPPATAAPPAAPAPVAAPATAPAAAPIPVTMPAILPAPAVAAAVPPPAAAPLVAAEPARPASMLAPTPPRGAGAAPTPGFWVAGAALALLLLTVSLVLGDAEWAFTARSGPSRLDALLRARRTGRVPVSLGLSHSPAPSARPV